MGVESCIQKTLDGTIILDIEVQPGSSRQGIVGDRAPANDAIEEPFLAILVGTVASQVLRTEGAHLQRQSLEVSLDQGVTARFLDGVAFDVRRARGRLVNTGAGHEEELGSAGGDGEISHRTDGVHILTVVVNDDVKLGAAVLGSHISRIGPHSLHAHRSDLIEERKRSLGHLLIVLRSDDVNRDVVTGAGERLRQPETNVRVASTVSVNDENLLLIRRFDGERRSGARDDPRDT